MQRYFAKDKIKTKLILFDSDIHHIKKVMRMKAKEKILVVYQKEVYLCEIKSVDNFELNIIDILETSSEMDTELIVAIGLVKEQKMDLILQKLTELGVSKIIPLKMERSIVKLDMGRAENKITRWKMICKEASEQSHRNIIPEVTNIMTIDEITGVNASLKMLCSVNEKEKKLNFYLQDKSKHDKIIFVIGPEGGISDKEETYLLEHGFKSVSLGNRVLRVETAAIYVASIISYVVG